MFSCILNLFCTNWVLFRNFSASACMKRHKCGVQLKHVAKTCGVCIVVEQKMMWCILLLLDLFLYCWDERGLITQDTRKTAKDLKVNISRMVLLAKIVIAYIWREETILIEIEQLCYKLLVLRQYDV